MAMGLTWQTCPKPVFDGTESPWGPPEYLSWGGRQTFAWRGRFYRRTVRTEAPRRESWSVMRRASEAVRVASGGLRAADRR